MAKGFAQDRVKSDPIVNAAELLLHVAGRLQKPLIMAMHPPGNDHGLQPGEMAMKSTQAAEIRPSCQGIVIAVAGSADDVQELIDLIQAWKQKGSDR